MSGPGKTAAQRKADERQRHREAGRVPVVVHVLPQFRELVRSLEAQLRLSEPMAKPALDDVPGPVRRRKPRARAT